MPRRGDGPVPDVRASVAHILAVADSLAVTVSAVEAGGSATGAAGNATPEVVAMGRIGVDLYPLQTGSAWRR